MIRSSLFRLLTLTLMTCGSALAGAAEQPVAGGALAELRLGSVGCSKILFLGNSITLHGPLASIGWEGNWGMAASAAEKDYVSLFTGRLAKATGGQPEVKVRNIADFERQFATYDIATGIKDELAFNAKLVIVALGENVPALVTNDDKTKFAAAFGRLLNELRKHGQPTLLVRSSFWADAAKDEIMQRSTRAAGGVFVDLSALGRQEANFARSERKIAHAGVASHPGDRGMQAIADALYAALEQAALSPAR